MKRGATEHPKMMMLASKLGIEKWGAIGIMEAIWHFTAKYSPCGDIGKYTDEMIAAGIGWMGDAKALIQALLDTHWLDKSGHVRLLVHDWSEHGDEYADKWLARNGLVYADGKGPRRNLEKADEVKGKKRALSGQVRKCPPTRAQSESESESESESPPKVPHKGDGEERGVFAALMEKCPDLRALSYEQWLVAHREHPVKLTAELEGWIIREAVLSAPIGKPGAWIRAKLSQAEVGKSEKTNNRPAAGEPADSPLERIRQQAAERAAAEKLARESAGEAVNW